MTNLLKYSLLAVALTLGTTVVAHARGVHGVAAAPPKAPEVDPGMAISGFTLLAGALTVARSHRRSS